MRLTSSTAIGVTVALLAMTVPAQADFHPDCTGQATAYANTDLTYQEAEETMVYEGVVNCPETEIAIHTVELDVRDPATGWENVDAIPEEICQTSLTEQSCSVADEATVDTYPVELEVAMTFSTPCCEDVDRVQRWAWDGPGNPVVPTCVHAGFFPLAAGTSDCPGNLLT